MLNNTISKILCGTALCAVVLLTGCASTLSSSDCATANWREVGKADAYAGHEYRTAEYRKICSKVNVEPNAPEYKAGYVEGVKEHCTYETGYELGAHGGRAEDSCINVPDYAKGYVKGSDEYVEKAERNKIDRLTRPRLNPGMAPGGGTN